MELKEYIRIELEDLGRELTKVMNGLTQQEFAWRPACGCNSMGIILFHIAKIEDWFVQDKFQNKPEVWDIEKWYQKLSLPENEAGINYTVEQVNAFPVPAIKDLLAYHDAVRLRTLDYLKDLTASKFDSKITLSWTGEITFAATISIMTGNTAQHIGEMSYLRGLQRGLDK
ncbi:DinB family protein [Chloroflexota bacterium]